MLLKLNSASLARGLVVRVEDFHAGTPGSTSPRHFGIFFVCV